MRRSTLASASLLLLGTALALAPAAAQTPAAQPTRPDSVAAQEFGGFHVRARARSGGRFITREEIERQKPRRTADLFRRISQFRVDGDRIEMRTARASRAIVTRGAAGTGGGSNEGNSSGNEERMAGMGVMGGGDSPQCVPAILVDGRPWDSGTGDLSTITPDQLEGIEVYTNASTAPPQFRGREGTCGIVVIWRRTAR